MESARRAKSRLAYYPGLVAQCRTEGTLYAACVLKQENVKLKSCDDEFQNFKKCLTKAAAGMKTRL